MDAKYVVPGYRMPQGLPGLYSQFCYAERLTKRWGQDFRKVILHPERLDIPLHWRKPRKIFVCSMSDLFQDAVPMEFIKQVLETALKAPEHTYQILTKRAHRMREIVTDWYDDMKIARPFPNLWLGVSAENQERADKRIPLLLQTPAAVRFVSLEPLLAPINMEPYLQYPAMHEHHKVTLGTSDWRGIEWVIVGGESGGPQERALVTRCGCRANAYLRAKTAAEGCGSCQGTGWSLKGPAYSWLTKIRDQCATAGVPFFYKQAGGPRPKSGWRLLDGRIHREFPS